jgi:hypothetical protein
MGGNFPSGSRCSVLRACDTVPIVRALYHLSLDGERNTPMREPVPAKNQQNSQQFSGNFSRLPPVLFALESGNSRRR